MVPARFISGSEAECIAPPSEAKIVNVDVTNDGTVFSPNSVPFEFTELHVDRLSETEGHISGGNVVALFGTGFFPSM